MAPNEHPPPPPPPGSSSQVIIVYINEVIDGDYTDEVKFKALKKIK